MLPSDNPVRFSDADNAIDAAARIEATLIAPEIGTWLWDIQHDQIRGDANLNALFGIKSAAAKPLPIGDYLSAIHPDDVARVTDTIARALADAMNNRYEDEYRLNVGGRIRWILARGIIKRNEHGQGTELSGVVIDITTSKTLGAQNSQLLEYTESQARLFETTLSAITDFAYVFDLAGRFVFVNKALLDLWGYRLDQAVGKTFFELPYPNELAAKLQSQIQQVIEQGLPLRDETPYTNPAGQTGFYEYIFAPVFGSNGAIEAVAGSTRDITDRKITESALQFRTAQYETLVNTAPLGVYLIDADFKIREVNPIAATVFKNIPDVIGRDLGEVFHTLRPADYADELIRRFRYTLATGEPDMESELTQQRHDVRLKEYYEWQISRIPLGNTFGVVCYFREISEQVHARRALEAADRQKNEFLAMLAHELRNPLAPIHNASEFLARTLTDHSTLLEPVNIIQRQVAQLSRLVDDLLDVSRISEGRLNLRLHYLDLGDVISQAIETAAPLIKAKVHNLQVRVDEQPIWVMGDSARLIQCVANILSNAAKYTDPGGQILLTLRRDGETAVISIMDNGIGLHANLIPKIFDLFVQGDRNLDRAQGGLGLGLALVKRLIEKHGGKVSAANRDTERGAVFEIRLPALDAPERVTKSKISRPVPPRRVLIVDDNSDAADSLGRVLQTDGHDIEVVYSGSQALDKFSVFKPEVVLLDIGLPDIVGYDVARKLRTLPGGESVCIVALTGYGQEDDLQQAIASGFDRHLLKPVDLEQLALVMTNMPKTRK